MKISDYYTYAPKSKIKAGDANPNGKYQFYTSSPDESRRCDEYLYDCKAIVMGTGGSATLHYYDGKFSTSTDCLTLIPNEKIRAKYLYYFFLANMDVLEAGFKGAGLKHTSKGYIDNIEITKIPSLPSQDKIVNLFDELALRIEKERRQIEKLDELVKARFVEMFGNVVVNDKSWATKPISSVAPASSPKIAVSENIWLLNLDMIESQSGKVLDRLIVSKNKINASTCAFDDKNVLYSKLRPYLNKVVLPDQEGYCTTELVPLRPSNELNREFLATLLRSDAFVGYINEKTAGAKMPRVSMNIFRQFECILPPITLQEQFSVFYKQIDKSKFVLSNELTMCDFYIRLIHDRVMHSRINLRVAQ